MILINFLRPKSLWLSCFLSSLLLVGAGKNSIGAEYKIGAGDELEVSFWQDQALNSNVTVSNDGKITLNIIGEIDAADKTTLELQTEIVRKISRLNKKISQAIVRVLTYNYNYVYVTGQVLTPGKRTFETIPDLWTIINEAGGAGVLADLSRVTIIRGGVNAGKVEVINVSQLLSTGQLDKLPKIDRTDTIEIPRSPANVPAGDLVQNVERKNLVYVLGAVTRPGPIQFESNTDILGILALAGGPTPDADLSKATVITKDGAFAQTFTVNLDRYKKTGKPARYILRKEDTFIVPRKEGAFLGLSLPVVIALLGGVSTAVITGTQIGII